MDLKKLFDAQRELDDHINKEKNLDGSETFPSKLLALQVEVGELLNELPEVFKYWSNRKNNYEKALEEYSDCLHFTLSIGLDLSHEYWTVDDIIRELNESRKTDFGFDVKKWFEMVFFDCAMMNEDNHYVSLLHSLLDLGYAIGFTWDQVEEAYFAKNQTNHKRQDEGY